MLAQSNLQLYHQLIEVGYGNEDLLRVRRTWELACDLFGHRYRPSGKPFVCHLVGVASGLVAWGRRPDMVIAGLLHSGYLYGDFCDGQKLDAPARRQYVRSIAGVQAEGLIQAYTKQKNTSLFEMQDEDLQILILADLLDELQDAGPAFAPNKSIPELSSHGEGEGYDDATIAEVLALTRSLVGESASDMLRDAIAACRAVTVPQCLTREKRSSCSVKPGVEALRTNRMQREWQKVSRYWNRPKAA